MFSTTEFSISIDDELSALLADYAAFVGDGSGLALESPAVDVSDPALSSAGVGSDPLTDGSAPLDASTSAVAPEAGPVVDPMASADTVVFTGDTAPTVADTGAAVDPTAVNTTDPAPVDLPADAAGTPSLDGLFQVEADGFDLDLTILEVGRAFGQFGFTDLP